MNRFWKVALVLGLVALLGTTLMAVEPRNIERNALRPSGTGYMYKPIVTAGAAQGVLTWTGIDSGLVDTSEAYQIVPGCYVAFSAVLDAAADTVDIRVRASLTGSIADSWELDSLISANGTALKARYIGGTAGADPLAIAPTPVIARYLWFVVTGDGDAAADTSNLTGRVVSSPTMND